MNLIEFSIKIPEILYLDHIETKLINKKIGKTK